MKGSAVAVTSCSLKAWRMVTLAAFRVKHTCCTQSSRVHVGRRRASAALGFLKNRTWLFTQGHLHGVPKKCLARGIRTVYPQKHIWKCTKEQSLDDRGLLETRSDVSLQFAAAMDWQVGLSYESKQLLSPQVMTLCCWNHERKRSFVVLIPLRTSGVVSYKAKPLMARTKSIEKQAERNTYELNPLREQRFITENLWLFPFDVSINH